LPKIELNSRILPQTIYVALFALAAVVYILGLFVPLMDNDSAHHANIALRMHLTGDYVNLIDAGKDYLDKPHLHFWLSAFSYKLFGVTGFAYKLPSFLFSIAGVWATYALGATLYNKEIGKLAALILTSAFAFVLANNDVRMDAILTSGIIIATWQLVKWVDTKRFAHVVGAALGLAIGFSTKGHIAVVTPGIGILFYIAYKKDWRSLYNWQILPMVVLFLLFISPVVYSYYLQYDLHPEKTVRGKNHISGVKFILWQQNFERFQGDSFGADAKNDRLFFIHSFLWAFAPWSFIGFVAFATRLKVFFTRRYEWLTVGTLGCIMVLISLSGFKLPHYLNIIFPISSILTASYLYNSLKNKKTLKRLLVLQAIVCCLLLAAAGLINVWAFPVRSLLVISGFIAIVAFGYFLFKSVTATLGKMITATAFTSLLLFYLLNTNFYPRLLQYQGGNEMAALVNNRLGGRNIFFQEGERSWSLNFYTKTLHQDFHDSVLKGAKPWVVTNSERIAELSKSYKLGKQYRHIDYEITRLQAKFINPSTRRKTSRDMIIAEVLRKK
jgi:4-amino-4-deoxy-L-arabinose transferase-like glycosyltransferase